MPVMAAITPDADFTANQTSVCTYQTIQFTDMTTFYGGTTFAWWWLFGDSQDSHTQNPTHYYDTVGTYTVQLWVQNDYGDDWENKTDYITVRDCSNLTLVFDANATCHIGKPMVVQFGSSCPPGDKYLWDFGDGNTSSLESPVYTYPDYGTYNVSITCNDPNYGIVTANKTDYVTVGVPGTCCYCGTCAMSNASGRDWLPVAVVLAFVPIWILIGFSAKRGRNKP